MKKRFPRIPALSLLAVLALSGCVTTSAVKQAPTPAQSAAAALIAQGKPREAAQQLENEAAQARGAARSRLLVDAAFAWHLANDDARASAAIGEVNPRYLGAAENAKLGLINGEIALNANKPQQALTALGQAPTALPQDLQPRWYLARAQALEATGDKFAAASARARADVGLATGAERADNQRQISKLLAGLDNATLSARAAALPARDPLYNFVGRALISRGQPLPHAFERGDDADFDLSKRPPAAADGYRPPVKLAVLLPLSGNLAVAAAPVRDGLLAGYYGENRRRPEIDFIDTSGTPEGATAAYQQAIDDGADYVVGPLGRDQVSALFSRSDLPVPVLALNRPLTNQAPPAGSIGFSLAPEDDGIMAAEYLLAHERTKALVIESSDDNGKRATESFRRRFTARGGQVIDSITVPNVPGDISAKLRADAAADGVFLAVRGPTARAVSSQLMQTGFGGKTRVATSQLVLGTGKPTDDILLDGIVFPAETWSTRGISGLPAASTAAGMLPTARGPAARLFAFGYDAWKITAYLEKLANETGEGLQGATGVLHLDGFGNVMRVPAWSTFNGGRPVPITGGH